MYLYLSRYCQILPQPFVYIEYAPPVYYLHLDKVHLISSAGSLVRGLKVWFGLQDQQLTPQSSFLTHHEHVCTSDVSLSESFTISCTFESWNFFQFLAFLDDLWPESSRNAKKLVTLSKVWLIVKLSDTRCTVEVHLHVDIGMSKSQVLR